MFDLLVRLSHWILPVFVISTMLNVGLTQRPSDLAKYFSHKKFYARMLFTSFVLSPAIMFFMLTVAKHFFDIPKSHSIALLIFSLVAGAPFLIKLTERSKNDIALGASLLMTLVVSTVILTPFLLPILAGLQIDGGAMGWALFKQLILPVLIGMVAVFVMPSLAKKVQPYVAKLAQFALYGVMASILVGYAPKLPEILGHGSLFIGVTYVLMIYMTGYFMSGAEHDHHFEEIGALGSAQRNTAAAMIIATQNFQDDPTVLVLITIVNSVALIVLLAISTHLAKRASGMLKQEAAILKQDFIRLKTEVEKK